MSNEIVFTPQRTRAVEKKKPGRKSNVERLEIRAAESRRARQLEVESKRATPVQPDTKTSVAVLLTLAGISLGTAFSISYATMVAVAEWMKLPWAGLQWIVPGAIEVLILFSSYDYIVSESRKYGSGRMPFWTMIGFSALAVLANGAHTISQWGSDFGGQNWQGWIGTALSASAPFVVVYVAKRLSVLVFAAAEPEA